MTDQIVGMALDILLEQTGMEEVIQSFLLPFIWIGFFIAAIQAFFGYLLLRIWIVINGILNGCIIGILLGLFIGISAGGSTPSMVVSWVLFGMIIGSIVGGMLAYKFWKIGVFLLCFGIGGMFSFILTALMFQSVEVGIALGFLLGIVIGCEAVMYVKPVVILITSIGNGFIAGSTLCSIDPGLGVVGGMICIFGGFYVQCIMNGNVFGIGTGQWSMGCFGQQQDTLHMEKQVQKNEGIQEIEGVIPITTGNNSFCNTMKTSKIRNDLTSYKIRVRNEREYIFPEAPIVIPQIQIADMTEDGKIGLYLSFQNIAKDKRVIAIYCDIHCYNVLKEKVTELKNISILDLSIESGQIVSIDKAILLPDSTIRKCDIVPRYVVFSDDTMWSYTGEDRFMLTPIQREFFFEHAELKTQFVSLIRNKKIGKASHYQYEPMSFEGFWYCGCGQLNKENSCVICGVRKEDIFTIMDIEYLKMQYQEELQRQEMERLEREVARKKKIQKVQTQTKQMMGFASEKGKEVLARTSEVGQKTMDTLRKQVEDTKQKVDSKKLEPQEDKRRYCMQCGTLYEEEDQYCMNCGINLREEVESKLCSNCNTANELDSVYCMSCGKKL